ncbi:hypothetical protein HA402_008953 [Bradysia odoriphaga]|nr:hypothetical protein HA402_008953 [Bradysia odoriphaga]
MKRHLCQKHPAEAAAGRVSIKGRQSAQGSSATRGKKKRTGKLSRGDYIKNCVLLAAVNMVAFLLFNSPFFRNLTLIHATYTKTIVNSSNIGNFLQQTEFRIRQLITKELKNRLISIKLDIATRHYRSMLCVNVQYYCSYRKKIVIRTLGCLELRRAHKSGYLEQRVYSLLSLYDIDRKNIYSYTSDNGANLLSLGKLIKKMQHGLNLAQEWELFKSNLVDSYDVEEELAPDDHDQNFQFEYEHNMHAEIDERTVNKLMRRLTSDDEGSPLAMLEIFGCAAHTVQLAVHDVLSAVTKTSIKHIRGVIKELRSSQYLDYGSSNLKSLKLNVCSRWNSLYKMFVSIVKRKHDLENLYERVPTKILPNIFLSSDDFQYMKDFNEAFDPIYDLTLALQAEQLAMSDVVVLWYKCKKNLNKLDPETNEFVEPLRQAFDRRTESIMSNPLIATAAYVDPRLNHNSRSSEFLGDMKEVAENRIRLVVKRLQELDMTSETPSPAPAEDMEEDEDDIDHLIELESSQHAMKVSHNYIGLAADAAAAY